MCAGGDIMMRKRMLAKNLKKIERLLWYGEEINKKLLKYGITHYCVNRVEMIRDRFDVPIVEWKH
jgi:hypothetical protein